MSDSNYPVDDKIKVEWNKFHSLIISISTICSIGGIIYLNFKQFLSFPKFLSIIGLYIDILGVLIASLKTPYFGAFMDGGESERKRGDEEKKWFVRGMYLIALGMILQVLGVVIQN